MSLGGRKVAVVGMGGAFPTCNSLEDFSEKLFSNQSLIREWNTAVEQGKKIRSTVSGFITEAEMNLEAIYNPIAPSYPEVYVDLLNRIPNINQATADMGSIWAMLGSLDAIKMSGWNDAETQSEGTAVVVGSGGGGHVIQRHAWHNFFELGKKTRLAGSHTVDRAMVYRDAANVSCLSILYFLLECEKQKCTPDDLKLNFIPAFISIGSVYFHNYIQEADTFVSLGKIKFYKFRQMVADGRIYKVAKGLDLDAYFSDFNETKLNNYDLSQDFTLVAELFDITGRALKKDAFK